MPYNAPDQEQKMTLIQTTQSLGKLIKATRKAQGLTQEQVASLSGVGRRFVSDLEAGKKSCHLDKVLSVVVMLGLEFHLQKRGD